MKTPICGSFVLTALIPLAIYLLSYLPWMLQPHHHELQIHVGELSELWAHQEAIWNYHAGLQAEHPYFSKWYTWPWLYRPTWYYFHGEGEYVRGIVAIGNPALWWAALPASLWAAVTNQAS